VFARAPHAVLLTAFFSLTALAQSSGIPRSVEFRFTPVARAQIALWIAKPDGTFLKTVALTQSVGTRGIGNRPGAAQMNSGFRWPYGRREGVLPIWAHRRALAPGSKLFRRVIFQNRQSEGFASRTSDDSTPDSYFCLSFAQATTPELRRQEALDAVTCASRFMSDKGRFVKDGEITYAEPAVVGGQGLMRALGPTSLYPPRRDIKPCIAEPSCASDTPDAPLFDQHARDVMPDIDAVTMATPPADVEQAILFTIPDDWPQGDYVAWIEVNVEGDYNSAFNDKNLPTPIDPNGEWDSWAIDSGYPYRGQPSVVFQAPFKLTSTVTDPSRVLKPSFYGDVDGFGTAGGDEHPMDGQITDDPTGAPGRGADRLRMVADHPYRFQVSILHSCAAHNPPSRPVDVSAVPVSNQKHSHEWGELRFVVPPASDVPVVHYEVRFSADPISEADSSTFDRALPAVAATINSEALTVPTSGGPGTAVTVDFGGMDPLTRYFVAVRAVDACNVAGPYGVAKVTTTRINFTKLSGCFIATAAYGSALEPQVEALRRARDAISRRSALFSIATDLYYRSGPAAAAVISGSAVARAVVRQVLAPVVDVAQAAYPSSTAERRR
jgi:hypothetical protein